MNAKEAVKCIEDVLSSEMHYDESLGYQLTSDDFEWMEEAKKALKKQMPKKPITDSTRYAGLEDFFCPSCKKRIISRLDGKWRAGILQKCCGECGQALDWSDV